MTEHELPQQRIASYEAIPDQVSRVLLLYSGGLDTSVMLRWIQETYKAEVVTLTINLGQPDEDYTLVTEKAKLLGAVETVVIDAREEFAAEYVLPAIKANALYGGGYPLFTALGRPLIAKLGVEQARLTGCDTIAHGCTGKGNDQVRLEATVATLDPDLKVIAPVREWQMGREEEIAYAREHGIPIKGGTEEAPPYSIDDNLWGRSSEGRSIEDLGAHPPDDVFQLVTPPAAADRAVPGPGAARHVHARGFPLRGRRPQHGQPRAAEHAHRYAKAGKGWRLARYAPVPDRVDEEDLKRVIKNLKQRKSTNLQSQGRLLAAMKKGEIINLAEMQIAARTLAEEFSNADAEQLAGFFAKAFEKPRAPNGSI